MEGYFLAVPPHPEPQILPPMLVLQDRDAQEQHEEGSRGLPKEGEMAKTASCPFVDGL